MPTLLASTPSSTAATGANTGTVKVAMETSTCTISVAARARVTKWPVAVVIAMPEDCDG